MENVILTLDDAIVKRVRRVALARDTTLKEMIQNYLEQVASDDQSSRKQKTKDIRNSFAKFSRPLGGKDWVREDLYE